MSEKQTLRRSLGRGLDALLGSSTPAAGLAPAGEALQPLRVPTGVPIANIKPGRFQPRRRFDAAEIEALAQSIREKGVLQPVLLRPLASEPGHYELIAGERRWRAAQRAQLHEIPALVRHLTDRDALEVALVENIQREDLTPIEEANGFRRLMDEFGHTQESLAQIVGMSRSHLANTLRLLELPDLIKEMVDAGSLSPGHARLLVGMDESRAAQAAAALVARSLSVREAELFVQRLKTGEGKRRARPPVERTPDVIALERDLSLRLGLHVELHHRGSGGHVVVKYKTLEQLDDLVAKLGRTN